MNAGELERTQKTSTLARLDRDLIRYLGYTYMRITRDDSSFDRIFYLIRVLKDFSQPIRLLDVGCGNAIALYVIGEKNPGLICDYVGVDMGASRLYGRYEKCKIPHRFVDANLDDDWNFGEFDVAWCGECLEHIVDDSGVFGKICRSIRLGGYIVVTMPSEVYRKSVADIMPELMEISPTQDGGHVRVGYTSESLVQLTAGTRAKLVRIDAVTRSDEAYLRRRYDWGRGFQPIRNAYYALTRVESDSYMLDAKPADLKHFQSIAAVYRVV